jgi:hypothetical protein
MSFYYCVVKEGIFTIGLISALVGTASFFIIRCISYFNCVSNCQALQRTSPIFKDGYEICVSGCQVFNKKAFIILLLYLLMCLFGGAFVGFMKWVLAIPRVR